jgi:MFS family permease
LLRKQGQATEHLQAHEHLNTRPPDRLRGTAYGIFNAALGVAALPASVIAGLLWDWYGPAAPFLFGAVLAVVATIGLLMIPLRR